jgi:integrase
MAKRLIGGNGMIFQDNYFAYAKYFRENTERLLGRSLTPHCLRHTHVALLAENGMPLDMISRRLGHQDSRITREVYFHVTEKLKEKENRMLQKVSIL